MVQDTKKMGFPAQIIVKEIMTFPHFQVRVGRGSIERGGRAILKIMQHAGRLKKNYQYIVYQ